jgi:hypothetical protein
LCGTKNKKKKKKKKNILWVRKTIILKGLFYKNL